MLTKHIQLIKGAVRAFQEENLFTHSAALAYYTIFALPPMLLVILSATGTLYNEAAVSAYLFDEIGSLVGQRGARELQKTLDRISLIQPKSWTTILSVAALLFTSTTVFVTMQNTLNAIFQVKATPSKSRVVIMIKDRLISFALLLSIAFILVVSLSLNTILVVLEGYLQASFGPVPVIIAGIITDLIPLIIMVCIFAMIFRLLPDVRMAWKNTWFGAIFTTGLFAIGQHLISLYIGSSPAINLYDTAGSIMVIMLWTFYTSIIFFFGAVLTREKVLMSPEKLHTTSFAVPKQEVMSEFDQHG